MCSWKELQGKSSHSLDYLIFLEKLLASCRSIPVPHDFPYASPFTGQLFRLAFPDPSNNFTPVLTQLFFGGEKKKSNDNEPSEQQLQPIFGLQSCGYEPILKVGGDGALDLGGFDSSHFEGQIQWSPVVEARYWGVHMTAVRLGHSSSVESESSLNLLPEEQRTALDEHGHARTVVDSGTSMLLFDPDTYASILDTLRSTLPDAKNLPDAFYDGQACAQLDEIDITKWPSLVLEFAGEKEEDPIKLSIPACRYVELVPPGFCIGNAPETRDGFRHDQPAYLFALGKMPPGQDALLGQALFEQYYVAHDMTPGKERIGFAPLAGCDAGSYCFDGYASPGLEQNTATAEAASPHRTLVWGLSFSIFTLAMFFRRKRNQRLTYTEIIDH